MSEVPVAIHSKDQGFFFCIRSRGKGSRGVSCPSHIAAVTLLQIHTTVYTFITPYDIFRETQCGLWSSLKEDADSSKFLTHRSFTLSCQITLILHHFVNYSSWMLLTRILLYLILYGYVFISSLFLQAPFFLIFGPVDCFGTQTPWCDWKSWVLGVSL